MSDITPFLFQEHQVRVLHGDGEPRFIAKDVAEALGYAKPENAIARHCKAATTTPKQGGGVWTIIPERDVYRLIMRSKLPSAQAFEEWVVGEVLPTIRKTGSYSTEEIILDFDNHGQVAGILAQTLQKVLDQQEQIKFQREKIKADMPKVEFYERFANADGLFGLQNAARALSQRPNKFIQWLKEKYLFYQGGNLVAYAKYIQQGLFEVKTTFFDELARPRTWITPKGIQYFAEKLKEAQA